MTEPSASDPFDATYPPDETSAPEPLDVGEPRTLSSSGLDARANTSAGRDSRLPVMLLWLFAATWTALAISPNYREAWLLENLIVFAMVPTLVWSYRRLPFRDISYIALFVFFALHEVGAHYTYAEVPFDRWGREWLGLSPDALFGFSRNHYDRMIHFLYGLLATPASLDIIDARARPTRMWRWLLVVAFVTAQAVMYEMAEWAAALVFAGDLGMAYLGTQGDVWDAQKDLLLAMVGSAITATAMWRAGPHAVGTPPRARWQACRPDRAP